MIFSMTGYGKAECLVANNKKLVVEIKSLNSKSLDLSVRIAPQLRSKELEIRTLMAQRLERGKIDLSIYYQDAVQGNETNSPRNTEHKSKYRFVVYPLPICNRGRILRMCLPFFRLYRPLPSCSGCNKHAHYSKAW